MVGKSGAFVLSVPADPDSTQYHPLFYRADACGGKSVQCTVAICFLLSINDFVERCSGYFSYSSSSELSR